MITIYVKIHIGHVCVLHGGVYHGFAMHWVVASHSSPQNWLWIGQWCEVIYLLCHSFSFFFFGREKAEENLLIRETQIRNGKEILLGQGWYNQLTWLLNHQSLERCLFQEQESLCWCLGLSLEGRVGITGCLAAGSLGTCAIPTLSWISLRGRNRPYWVTLGLGGQPTQWSWWKWAVNSPCSSSGEVNTSPCL